MSNCKNNKHIFMVIFAGAPPKKRWFSTAYAACGAAKPFRFLVSAFAGKH
jgi:hypothetical protein